MLPTNKLILTTIIAISVSTSASALEIGAGASIGGVSGGVGASIGHGSGASVGVGVGLGVGHGSSASAPGSAIAPQSNIIDGSAAEVKSMKLLALVGATVMSTDRKMIGMVEDADAAPNDKIVVTIRLNAALGSEYPTVKLRMNLPNKNPKRLRLGYTAYQFLTLISG